MGVVVQSQQSPEGDATKTPSVTVYVGAAHTTHHHPILILPCMLCPIHTLRRRNGRTSTTSFAAVSSTGTRPKNKPPLDLCIGPAIGRKPGLCYDMLRSKGGIGWIHPLKYPFLYLGQVLVCFFFVSKAMLEGDGKSQFPKGANVIVDP